MGKRTEEGVLDYVRPTPCNGGKYNYFIKKSKYDIYILKI
jgi:hypothetical protein